MASTLDARAPRCDTVQAWLAWFETLHPKKIDFSLDRVRRVLDSLGLVPPAYRVITVAGTNGKGSCVAMLESIYAAAGYRVGAFTSPHLIRFNERIRIDKADLEDAHLCTLFDAIDRALGQDTLSYFEASAVVAILAFARAEVDVAILEVGMGGRLDAVNALDADAALIVSIDLDHMEWLGPDREAIGREKAGILRGGRPAIIADREPPYSVLNAIDAIGAEACIVGSDYTFDVTASGVSVHIGASSVQLPRPRFGGQHQAGNAAACVAVVERLGEVLPVTPEALVRGIELATVPGRFDMRYFGSREWIFDVAHNEAAAGAFAVEVRALPAASETVAVFGAMRDKQLDRVIAPFARLIGHWYIAPLDSDRTASAQALGDVLREAGAGPVSAFEDVRSATLAAAKARADRVLVFGSFYTVGPAIETLQLYSDPHSPGDPRAWNQG